MRLFFREHCPEFIAFARISTALRTTCSPWLDDRQIDAKMLPLDGMNVYDHINHSLFSSVV